MKRKKIDHLYVSRGGVKLEHALKEFQLDVTGKTVIDIGASTGGFTDCLLQHGAAKVYAVDVAYGILAWKLRKDPRVIVVERCNARNLTWDDIRKVEKSKSRTAEEAQVQKIDLAVIDVSFIGLSKILPAVYNLLAEGGEVVALIKPQFEAKREEVGKGGIVRDGEVRMRVREKVKTEAQAIGFEVAGETTSPITGTDGNIEFFIYLKKR